MKLCLIEEIHEVGVNSRRSDERYQFFYGHIISKAYKRIHFSDKINEELIIVKILLSFNLQSLSFN